MSSTSSTVGESTPGTNPADAWVYARRGSLSSGSPRISGLPRSIVAIGAAIAASASSDSAIAVRGRRTVQRITRATTPSAASGSVARAGGRCGQNSRRPSSASEAGTNVIATAIPISTASARPGPNALRNPSSATINAPHAAATASPQARMIGVSSAVVARAAACGSSPLSSRRRKRDRKNSE